MCVWGGGDAWVDGEKGLDGDQDGDWNKWDQVGGMEGESTGRHNWNYSAHVCKLWDELES